jgi:hypothetical protein
MFKFASFMIALGLLLITAGTAHSLAASSTKSMIVTGMFYVFLFFSLHSRLVPNWGGAVLDRCMVSNIQDELGIRSI